MSATASSWQRWIHLLERENQGQAPLDRLRQAFPGELTLDALHTPSTPGVAEPLRVPWRAQARPDLSLSLLGSAGGPAVVAALNALADRGLARVRVELDAVTSAGKDADAGARQPMDGWRFSASNEVSEAAQAARAAGATLSLGGGAFASPLQALLDAADGTSLAHEARVDPWVATALGKLPIDQLHAARKDAAAMMLQRTQEHRPGLVVEVRGDHWELLGAAPSTLLGLTLATVIEALRDGIEATLALDEICASIGVALPAGRDSFLRIAMFRAARLLLARALEVAGATQPPHIHLTAIDDLRGRTVHDRWVNQLRTTAGAFAGIVGGADEISTLAADALVNEGSTLATRIALQAPLVLLEESWLDATADPAAGSWHLDTLTARLAEEAWALMARIEGDGGLSFALGEAWLADRVAADAAQRADAVATGAAPLLGTTSFAWPNEPAAEAPACPRLDPETLAESARAARKATPAQSIPDLGCALPDLRNAATHGATLELLHARTVHQALREQTARPVQLPTQAVTLHPTWGTLIATRDAAPWERLRERVERLRSRDPALARVAVLVVGDAIALKPRAAFATGWAQACGFVTVTMPCDAATSEGFAQALAGNDPTGWTLLVGADTEWPTWAANGVSAARAAGSTRVWIAGRAPRDAGADVLGGADALLKMGARYLDLFEDLVTALETRS